MTAFRSTSTLRLFALAALLVTGCSEPSHAQPVPGDITAQNQKTPSRSTESPSHPAEAALGVADTGIFSDLDPRVQIAPPPPALLSQGSGGDLRAVIDLPRALLTLHVGHWPVKIYPLNRLETRRELTPSDLEIAALSRMLRPGDRAELAPFLRHARIDTHAPDHGRPQRLERRDRDRDGIADRLDVLVGAKKTVLNAASYGAGYIPIDYPMGDVPRDVGVCTDVVIRAVRNAGLDLQRGVRRDLLRSPRSYPMVEGKGNRNIDHRRVKTLLPYFKRKWDQRSRALDDPSDPLRPGDIVFMDTFPSRSGPDHIGIVSDQTGDSGFPLVINNWTDGHVTAEMDLLGWVPVTHRFRFPSRP